MTERRPLQVSDAELFGEHELCLELEVVREGGENVADLWTAHMDQRWASAVDTWHGDATGIKPGEAYLARDGQAACDAWREAFNRAKAVHGTGGEVVYTFVLRYPSPPCRPDVA